MMEYVDRGEWGARPPKAPYTGYVGSDGIVVHHLGDGLPVAPDGPAKLRGTQNYHMDTKGWNDIAYGWSVHRGKIYRLRGWGVIDGADTGVGRLMHSVLWLGDSNVSQVPEADKVCLNAVIDEHNRLYGEKFVGGHQDINSTDCPGTYLDAWLDAGRPSAAPAPTPPEEDVVKSIVGWDGRDSQWYHIFGNVAVKISGEAAGALKYIGVTDVGSLAPQYLAGLAHLEAGVK